MKMKRSILPGDMFYYVAYADFLHEEQVMYIFVYGVHETSTGQMQIDYTYADHLARMDFMTAIITMNDYDYERTWPRVGWKRV